MTALVLIVAFVIAVLIARQAYLGWVDKQPRQQLPNRSLLEITLPHGEFDAADRMARIIDRIGPQTSQESSLARSGEGQITVRFLLKENKLNFFLECDPEVEREVRSAVQTAFGSNAGIRAVSTEEYLPHQFFNQKQSYESYREPEPASKK